MSDLVERLEAGICDDKCKIRNIEGGCTCAIAAARIKALEDWQAKAVDVIDDLINSIDALKTFTVDPHSVDAARTLLGGSNVSK